MPGWVSLQETGQPYPLLHEDMQIRLLGNITAPFTVWCLMSALRNRLLLQFPELRFPPAPVPMDQPRSATSTPSTELNDDDDLDTMDTDSTAIVDLTAGSPSSTPSASQALLCTHRDAAIQRLHSDPATTTRTALQLMFFCQQLLLSRMHAFGSDNMAPDHHDVVHNLLTHSLQLHKCFISASAAPYTTSDGHPPQFRQSAFQLHSAHQLVLDYLLLGYVTVASSDVQPAAPRRSGLQSPLPVGPTRPHQAATPASSHSALPRLRSGGGIE